MSSQTGSRLRLISLLFIVVTLHLLMPAFTSGQESRVVILEHADSLVGRVINGENVRELIGSVRFLQENVRVRCNHALQYLASGKVELTGNVIVTDDTLVMKFPRGFYYRDERRAQAFDSVSLNDGSVLLTAKYAEYFVGPKRAFFRTDVFVQDSASVLTSDSLTYFRGEQLTIARGNVKVFNSTDNLSLYGHYFESDARKKFNRMKEDPVLVKFDTSASGIIDTLVVRSKVMEAYRDSVKKLLAIDDVEIIRSDLAGVAGHATFFTEGDSILLRQTPILWYEETQVSGDSIDVFLIKRQLDRISVMGSAFAISRSDSAYRDRFDQVKGERIGMQFNEKALTGIDVDNQAMSVYHLYDEKRPNGLNQTSGDKLVMMWGEKKLQSIRIYGGIEGTYFPENLVVKKESDFHLTGFHWLESRPNMKPEDFRIQPSDNEQSDTIQNSQ